MAKMILLGILTVTAYQPRPEQTKPACKNRHFCETSIGDNVSETGIAVSQDLLRSGAVHYGDCLYVPGIGYRVVNDCMAGRITKGVDILVFTRAEEKKIGVRHLKVYKVQTEE